MKKIGNIISLAKPENFSPLYNVVKNYEDKIDGIPTLIIGWENAKKYIPDVNILKKQSSNFLVKREMPIQNYNEKIFLVYQFENL